MANILVTGATGFVGGRIALRLRERGDQVVATVRTPSADLEDLGVEQVAVGLDIPPVLLAGIDAVVHAAAGMGPDLDDARRVNRDGTRTVCDAALTAGTKRLVHISTTSVYDLTALGDATIGEDAPLAAANGAAANGAAATGSAPSAYSITKAEAEAEVRAATGRGLSTAILRPPAVLGAGPSSTWGTLVPTRIRDGDFPARNPDTTFGYVEVEDLVDATLAALASEGIVTANVVGGHTTVGRYLDAVADLLPGEVDPPVCGDDAAWRGSYTTDRLPATLGVTPSRRFEVAMAEIAAWWADGDPGVHA